MFAKYHHNLVAFVIVGETHLDCEDEMKLFTYEFVTFNIFILKSPAIIKLLVFKNSERSQKISSTSMNFGMVPECGRYKLTNNKNPLLSGTLTAHDSISSLH